MAVKRFNSRWKTREDLTSNITPIVFWNSQDMIKLPGEHKPASWLPIQWIDAMSEDAFVISKGKVLAHDTTGRVVPAGLRIKLLTNNLVYTQDDVDYGVTDLTTGEALTGTATYTPLELARAIVERGLVLESDISSVIASQVIPAFISHPIGVAEYDIYVWAGDDQTSLAFTNYQKQIGMSVVRYADMMVPHMASSHEASDDIDMSAFDSTSSTVYAAGSFPAAGEFWDAVNLALVNRYAAMNVVDATPVVAFGLLHQPVAKNTDRTPFTADDETVLVRERPSPTDITQEGDWWLDAETGVLFIHEDTFYTLSGDAVTVTFDYDYYGVGTATAERWIYVDGRVKAGDRLVVDEDSNFTLADLSTATFFQVIGSVREIVTEPRGLLDRVRTAWNFTGVPKTMQMPGTATKGFSNLITAPDEPIANRLAVITLDVR